MSAQPAQQLIQEVAAKFCLGGSKNTPSLTVSLYEPPPNTHTKEDESFYLINGEIDYFVGDIILCAKPEDWVFLPRNIQHSFKVTIKQAEVLIHLSPGGFENYFIKMSAPACEMVIPPKPQGPPDVQKFINPALKSGMCFPVGK